jgi:hypothetical protein
MGIGGGAGATGAKARAAGARRRHGDDDDPRTASAATANLRWAFDATVVTEDAEFCRPSRNTGVDHGALC